MAIIKNYLAKIIAAASFRVSFQTVSEKWTQFKWEMSLHPFSKNSLKLFKVSKCRILQITRFTKR